jgi:hypothetical protein
VTQETLQGFGWIGVITRLAISIGTSPTIFPTMEGNTEWVNDFVVPWALLHY